MMRYARTAQTNELQFFPQIEGFPKEYDPTRTNEILNIKGRVAEAAKEALEKEISSQREIVRTKVGPKP
jgi:hypothetical protein